MTRSRLLDAAAAVAVTLNLTFVLAAWWHRPGLVAVTAAAAVVVCRGRLVRPREAGVIRLRWRLASWLCGFDLDELYQLLADTTAQRDHWHREHARVADLLARYTRAGAENPVRVAFVLEATEAVLVDVMSMLASVLEATGDAVPDVLRDEVAHVAATGRRWRDGEGMT